MVTKQYHFFTIISGTTPGAKPASVSLYYFFSVLYTQNLEIFLEKHRRIPCENF